MNEEETKKIDNVDQDLERESADSLPDSDSISDYVKKDSIWTNLILAALFCNFMYLYYIDFAVHRQFSGLLMMIQVFFIITFFVYRDYPRKVSFSPQDWGVALAGTWLPILILPVEGQEIGIVTLIQFIGILISTAGIISLNNSFGIVPAVRRVKTGWMYRMVRHPIYFGYMISFTCLVINNFSMLNVLVLVAIVICDVLRILAEEKILSEDGTYLLYKERVRYRLIPYVW